MGWWVAERKDGPRFYGRERPGVRRTWIRQSAEVAHCRRDARRNQLYLGNM